MFEHICSALNILPTDIINGYPPDVDEFIKSQADVVSEPKKEYQTIEKKYKDEISALEKRIKELQRNESVLERTLEIVESQYQRKCIELDKCETMLSEANREK